MDNPQAYQDIDLISARDSTESPGIEYEKPKRRSRMGCLTCRKRKKRCDEVKPVCNECKRLDIGCVYPIPGTERRNKRRRSSGSHKPSVSEADDFEAGNCAGSGRPGDSNARRHGEIPRLDDSKALFLNEDFIFPLHFSDTKETPSILNNMTEYMPLTDFESPAGSSLEFDERKGGPGSLFMMSSDIEFSESIYMQDIFGPKPAASTIDENITDILQADAPSVYDDDPNGTASVNGNANGAANGSGKSAVNGTNGANGVNGAVNGMAARTHKAVDEAADKGQGETYKETLAGEGTKVVRYSDSLAQHRSVKSSQNRSREVQPLPTITPGPTTEQLKSVYPELTKEEVRLFEYSRDKVSVLVSVSPVNYFRSVFLTLCLRCRPTLYAIISYSAYHIGNNLQGKEYFVKATKLLQDQQFTDKLAKEEVLGTILLLASAKIFSGEFSDWRWYMVWAGQVIQYHGGIFSFMESESVRWLLRNFAYKEILTAASTVSPYLFSSAEIEFILSQTISRKWPDSNFACCDPLFLIIAKTNELNLELRKSDLANEEILESVFRRTHLLEAKIRHSRPDMGQLENLGPAARQLQMCLFSVFQHVALLYIYQSILKSNSSTLRVRYVNSQLLRTLPDLIGSGAETILMFPLFISGISCADPRGRQKVMAMFDTIISRVNTRNEVKIQQIIRDVWERDNLGSTYVDWNALMDEQGVNPSFI